MATYAWRVKNTFVEVMEPNEPSATMGRNQTDGRANSCPPVGERVSTSYSQEGVAMLHAVGVSISEPPKFRQAVNSPAASNMIHQ